MNKRQLVVVWVIAILLSMGAIASTYKFTYCEPNNIDSLLREENDPIVKTWHADSTNNPYLIMSNLIRYMLPVMIIGSILIYTLKSKKK